MTGGKNWKEMREEEEGVRQISSVVHRNLWQRVLTSQTLFSLLSFGVRDVAAPLLWNEDYSLSLDYSDSHCLHLLSHGISGVDIVNMMWCYCTWLVSLFLLVWISLSLSLSFSLDDLKVGPQKLRLLFSLTGSAIGVTWTDAVAVVVVILLVIVLVIVQ